jgi:hypothetical protein
MTCDRDAADRLSAEFGYVSEPEPRVKAEVNFCRHSGTARSAGPGSQIQIRCLFLDSGFARFVPPRNDEDREASHAPACELCPARRDPGGAVAI